MVSFLSILGTLGLIYISSILYRLLTNLFHAKKSGLPYIIVPWDQNHFIWMIISVPLRPWIATKLPKWINDRLSLTIYGYEFHEKLRPFDQYAAPQGNDMSYALVTPGTFEFATRDPEVVSEILRRTNDFLPGDLTDLFMAKFGANVLTSYGDSWARQRKIVAGVINERISKTVFNESIYQTEGLVDEVLGSGSMGDSNRIFDMMKKITINVLSGAGMGASVEWKDEEKPVAPFKQTYIEAVKHVINNVAGPIILPQWFLDNYPSFLPGYKILNPLGFAVKEFPIHTRNKLEFERQRTMAAHGETRSNIMSQLIHASEDLKGGKALSEDEMLGNLFIFTAAGFDTTANTLAYALALLCRYPGWQDWLFEEIDAIMPANSNEIPDYTTIFPKAIRVQACMLEVLRLFPPVIHMSKMTKSPQKITTSRGEITLPAKTTVYTHNVALHIDPTVWRNLNLAPDEVESATDELAFRPTRWLMPSSSSSSSSSSSTCTTTSSSETPQLFKPPKGSYVPWSSGPRICPGQKMAQVEFAAIFLKLFQKQRIEAVMLEGETSEEVEKRLDGRMRDSLAILTLQMNDVYDVEEGEGKGLKLRLSRR